MDRARQQLLIGLDAMEYTLVRRWSAEGKLPTFRRLLQSGTRAELSTTSEQLPDTVWACLYTGVNPAKFEKYFYVQYDPSKMGLRHVSDDAITATPFWDYLSGAGKRTGVLDAPKFRLSEGLEGFQLTNWGAHATKTARAASPPSLLADVQARFGDHPVGDCDRVDDRPKSLAQLRQHVLDGVHAHGELFRAQMREREWEVFFSCFSAPHCIGHHFWFGLDPSHPKHSDPERAHLKDTIQDVYQAIDREIGQMIDIAGPEALVMVFAAHGMGHMYHASWNLPEILNTLGYGRTAPEDASMRQPREARVNPWRILKMVVPGWLQYRIKAMLPKSVQDKLLFLWYSGGAKWEGCRAFAIPNNDSVGAIRIAVRGRDRNGIVEPGEEYDAICRDIQEALYELRDTATNRQVVKKVTLSREQFHGPYLDQLPDLTVLWDQDFSWNTVASPRLGELRLRNQDGRTGSHTPRGFLIAMGQEVEADCELQDCSIYDVAPTVLQMAGIDIPPSIDGTPMPIRKVVATAGPLERVV